MLAPALLNWRNLPTDNRWQADNLWYYYTDTLGVPLDPLRRLVLLFTFDGSLLVGQGNRIERLRSYVAFSECPPESSKFPEILRNLLDLIPLPRPLTKLPTWTATYQHLGLRWDPTARTVASDFDVWCEPPLYLFNTTHSYLSGPSTVCGTCDLPFVDRSVTRPDLMALRGLSDPTQYEFLEACSGVCGLGTEPNVYRTGCVACDASSFSFRGACTSCPTVNGPGATSISGDRCVCDSGYVFRPVDMSSTPAVPDASPVCIPCGENTVANEVANECDPCPAGQGRAAVAAGLEQATSCSVCPELTYNPDGGAEGCRGCPTGAVLAPLSTFAGDTVNETRRTTCACGPGHYFDGAGTSCLGCPARTVNAASGSDARVGESATCTECPLGTSPNEARTECVPCADDEQPLAPGVCYRCAAGSEYVRALGNCVPCLEGYISVDGSSCSGCGVGRTSDRSRTVCVICPNGEFSDGEGPCSACPHGLEPNAAQVVCECPGGFRQNEETGRCELQ